MEKFKELMRIKELYSKGENIIQYLKSFDKTKLNTIEDILISYDFQAGSYIKNYSKDPTYLSNYSYAISAILNKLGAFNSILEAGVGEATTLNALVKWLSNKPIDIYGFDLSWSRLKFANCFLRENNLINTKLFTANLFEVPLLDNSVDIVYTSHSIEPNGGKETEALKELYRITRKYLILLEPSYEFASEEGKMRMKQHGYVTELYATAKKLKFKIIEHRLFDISSNPLNPTGLLIIEKSESNSNSGELVCPITHSPLIKYNDHLLYSKDSLLGYPVIDQIPCLLKENSILATHLLTDYETFKKENNIVSTKFD